MYYACMALSKTAILNRAIINLGLEPILSPGDDNRRARLASLLYDTVVDGLLEASPPWNFATKPVILSTALSNTPTWGFAFSFAAPSDWLAHIHTEGINEPFRLEHDANAGTIYVTDLSTLRIKYVARITNTTQWPHMFHEAVAFKLAAELSIPLTRRSDLRTKMEELALQKLDDARYNDHVQSPQETVVSNRYLVARLSGSTLVDARTSEDATG